MGLLERIAYDPALDLRGNDRMLEVWMAVRPTEPIGRAADRMVRSAGYISGKDMQELIEEGLRFGIDPLLTALRPYALDIDDEAILELRAMLAELGYGRFAFTRPRTKRALAREMLGERAVPAAA